MSSHTTIVKYELECARQKGTYQGPLDQGSFFVPLLKMTQQTLTYQTCVSAPPCACLSLL